jgi:GH24 family phage-related lysozyme (muramidase)/uncharacterized protein YvpB
VSTTIRLLDLFKFYKQLPHQSAAISELEEAINKANPHILGRDQAWFKTWSAAGKQQDLGPALKLIQEFENCRLDAYRCPAGRWTVGFGNTSYASGQPVKEGDKITRAEADLLLRQEVDRIAAQLAGTIPHWREMSVNQRNALISFAFNLGSNFYNAKGFETITARLRDKEWAKVPDAMLLYRNPGSTFEAGLRRRREAEGRMWLQGLGLPPVQQQPIASPLNVPFYAQLDSATDQGRRMCFSSSCAMLLQYLKPGTLKGFNGDDQYLRTVRQFGDTTSAAAQVKALARYGIKARFVQNASFAALQQQIDKGIPVPCGYLHRGPVSKPQGGGHYLCVIGYEKDAVIVHDPLGEADLINGTTLNKPGKSLRYSRKNWGPRWEAEGPGTGWAILAER